MNRRVTTTPQGHNLTNAGVWSPDSEWIAYDTRLGENGSAFDGNSIEAINIRSGEVRKLYESKNAAKCGVVTWHPHEWKLVFILGPENPTPDWQYGFNHRQGVVVEWEKPLNPVNLDARDLTWPFTPGALRGGSHVHVWDTVGDWISFTYHDALVETDVRDIGISVPNHLVQVPTSNCRNHSGTYFSVLVSRTVANPLPGSDEINRACEEAWIGSSGYVHSDGTLQRRALAFQGSIITPSGASIVEAFAIDLPVHLQQAGEFPISGTEKTRPNPPMDVKQRRLTFTTERKYPGIQGPRHWLRSSPDGTRIAFLMKDDGGIVQIWTVSPTSGNVEQITHNGWDIASSFTWNPNGQSIAHVMDNSIFLSDVATGHGRRLTPRRSDRTSPRPEACVFSPDGAKIAFMQRETISGIESNHILVAFLS